MSNYKYDIFISHQGNTKPFCLKLHSLLEQYGVDSFIDKFSIKMSEDNKVALEDGMLKSEHFLCVLSEKFIKSKWCMWELKFAIESKIKIIPLFYDHPPSMSIDSMKQLSGLKIELFDSEEESLNKIATQLIKIMMKKYTIDEMKIKSVSLFGSSGEFGSISINKDHFLIKLDQKEERLNLSISDCFGVMRNIFKVNSQLHFQDYDSEFLKYKRLVSPLTKYIYKSDDKEVNFHCSKLSKTMLFAVRKIFNLIEEDSTTSSKSPLHHVYLSLLPIMYFNNYEFINKALKRTYSQEFKSIVSTSSVRPTKSVGFYANPEQANSLITISKRASGSTPSLVQRSHNSSYSTPSSGIMPEELEEEEE